MTQDKYISKCLDTIESDVLISAMGDGLTVHDRDFRIVYQNDKMKDLFGDCRGMICYEAYEKQDTNCPNCPVVACFADGDVHRAERTFSIKGEEYIFSNTAAPIRNIDGEIVAAVEVVRDITERKLSEERHIRFKHLYAALSLTNKAIICINNPEDLFNEICHIAVEHGKFSLATIVKIDSVSGMLTPVVHNGNALDYLESLIVSSDPSSIAGQGPTGIAFRSGVPYICNDFINDPVTTPWRTAALKNGIRSSAAFPLEHEKRIIGAFKVYSEKVGFFDSEIINLLQEMAANISFALNNYSHEELRKQAESALMESENRLKLVLEGSREGYCDWDVPSGDVKVSRRFVRMLGYVEGEIEPKATAIRELIHPDDRIRVDRLFYDENNGLLSAFDIEIRLLAKSEEWTWIMFRGKVVERDAAGNALRVTGTCSDINEKKRYEENLQFISTHDSLTGLFNRAYFETEMTRIAQGRQYPLSILMADVDGLKLINDSFGHMEGDRLIKQAAQAFKETFRNEDMVARIGGDEFAILLPNTDAATANALIKRVRKCQEVINERNSEYTLSISIGSAVAESGEHLNEALKMADSKMYYYKMQRKLQTVNSVRIF
ncbi:MAG: diguanylate cyclase [Desulfuromonadaceae bacterium]|nr:diguanylate cyclase [Desulfuromonadaceae bacterium]MDD5106150.1 diguanylate cyclase [Desulfuromonadaceae bacterium]